MEQEKTEFNFKPYTEAEADRFITELPIIMPIKQWNVQYHVKWNNTNPSEHWTAVNYMKSENEHSPYFSLERDLWVVGGHDEDFYLAKIEMPDQTNNDAALNWLQYIERNFIEHTVDFNKGPVNVKGAKLTLLLRTGIQTRTNPQGKPYCFGDRFGRGEKFYYSQRARFQHGKEWKRWVSED